MSGIRSLARVAPVAFAVAWCAGSSAGVARAEDASPDSHHARASEGARVAAESHAPEHSLHTLFVPAVHPDFSRLRPGWRDAAYVVAAGGATALAMSSDLAFDRSVTARDSQRLRQVSSWIRPLGNEVLIGSGIAAWGLAWWANRDVVFQPVQRIDIAIASAGLTTFAGKQLFGRKRPFESPDDAASYEPFSGHDSFPSGHSTLAFAAAAALDRETATRWVPAIGYPLAALIGWSRVHDRQHWPSDVVAGAAVGFGVAWKAEDVLRPRAGQSTGARIGLESGDGALAAVRLRW